MGDGLELKSERDLAVVLLALNLWCQWSTYYQLHLILTILGKVTTRQ